MQQVVAIIGAGSNYTPNLVDAFLRRGTADLISEIRLIDPDGDRLNTISDFVRSQVAKKDPCPEIHCARRLRGNLHGVDILITLFRVGGLSARHEDESAALNLGVLGQETHGWGGLASALRNLPMVAEIARELISVGSRAWVVNVTNPVGIITAGFHRSDYPKACGICEIPLRMRRSVRSALNLDDLPHCSYVGLNHLSWITGISADAHDEESLFDEVFQPKTFPRVLGGMINDGIVPEIYADKALARHAIPSPYLRYYHAHEFMVDLMRAKHKTRAEVCMGIDHDLMSRYRRLDHESWRTVSRRRGGICWEKAPHKRWNTFSGPAQTSVFCVFEMPVRCRFCPRAP